MADDAAVDGAGAEPAAPRPLDSTPVRATRAVVRREEAVAGTLLRTRGFGQWVELLSD